MNKFASCAGRSTIAYRLIVILDFSADCFSLSRTTPVRNKCAYKPRARFERADGGDPAPPCAPYKQISPE
jgi:hypothetical protein